MILDLQSLMESVETDKTDLGENIDKLEEGEKLRCKERNFLLQRAFKKVNGALNDVDTKMMAGIKTDAYDASRQLDKVQREVKKLLTDIQKADESEEDTAKALVAELRSKKSKSKVGVGSITSMCDVSLGYNVEELERVLMKEVFSLGGIYLKNASFDPRMFEVSVADSSLREKLKLTDNEVRPTKGYAYFVVRGQNPQYARFSKIARKNMMVEAVAFNALGDFIPLMNTSIVEMKKNNQMVVDFPNQIVFRFKIPSSLPQPIIRCTVSIFKTVLNGCPSYWKDESDGSGINATDLLNLTTKLDESKYFGDLDEEDRCSLDMTNRKMAEEGLSNELNESAMPNTALPTPMPMSAALPRLAKIKQQEAAPTTPPPNSLKNYLASVGTVITKRVPNLSDVGEVTGEADVSPLSPGSDNGIVEESVLFMGAMRPKTALEDRQKDEDQDLVLEGPEVQETPVLNRSVSFATKTKIFNKDLTTPQVEQGITKVKDGQAGVAKRLDQGLGCLGFLCDEELDDPHLYLNASKAPSPTLADKSIVCDPAWDIGSGYVKERNPSPLNGDASFATKVGLSDQTRMDMSVWEKEEQSPKDLSGFNLALGLVEQVETYTPSDVGEGKSCQQSPVHVEYAASFSKFLISEPEYNRIGVYSKETLSFQGWFGGRSDPYDYPTSILYMDNGYIAVLERSKINVYDKDAKLIQKIDGRFNGLAKAEGGDFVSTQKNKDMKTRIVVIGQVNGKGEYVIKNISNLFINVITNNMKSKVRFLAVHAGKIYASDLGLDSIYVVDMQTGSQISWDFECKTPCGMLVDDLGNVLLADSGNNRLVVLNTDGQFVREFGALVEGASAPSDMVKVQGKSKDGLEENHILVTYSGNDGTDGRVARFKCI